MNEIRCWVQENHVQVTEFFGYTTLINATGLCQYLVHYWFCFVLNTYEKHTFFGFYDFVTMLQETLKKLVLFMIVEGTQKNSELPTSVDRVSLSAFTLMRSFSD